MMKASPTVTLLFVFTSAQVSAQRAVPMHQEPRHHLVLQRPTFQIVDARIPPGDTTLFHTHDAPIHYVTISQSVTTSQVLGQEWPVARRSEASPRPVGSATWSLRYAQEPLTHRVANVGNDLYRLMAVTNLTPGRASGLPADAATTAILPGVIEVESEWFSRARLQLHPGEQTRVRSTPNDPVVAIQVADGALELLSGAAVVRTSDAVGDWLLAEGAAQHVLRNVGSTTVTVVLIQVRS